VKRRLGEYLRIRVNAFVASALWPGKGPPATDLVEAWRASFWGRFALIRASREPARALLPEDERAWRQATWRHFRFVLIRHLQTEGAHSLGELVGDPPVVLGLKLNRRELKAVVDSARRREEIAELPGAARSPRREAEWTVTDHGKKVTAHAMPWVFSQSSQVRTWIAPSVAALSVFGVGVTKVQSPSIGLLVAASLAVGLLVWLLASIRSVTSGAKAGRRVARDWSRWGREYPGWYRIAFRPFPWRSALLATAASLLGISLFALGHEAAGYALAVVALVGFMRVIFWKERWDQI